MTGWEFNNTKKGPSVGAGGPVIGPQGLGGSCGKGGAAALAHFTVSMCWLHAQKVGWQHFLSLPA